MNTLRLKTVRDLWLYKSRTILVVLAIAVGVAAVGVATTSLIVLRRDLRDGYLGTNPAHAILSLTPFDESLARQVAALPEVAAAEARRQTAARLVLDSGETRPLQLWTLSDFDAAAIGTLYRQPGALVPPPEGALLLERSVVPALGIAEGETITIQLIGGAGATTTARLQVAGFVNDMAVAPTTVQPGVYGYLSDATAARLGLPEAYDQLSLTVSAADPDRAAVEESVTAVTEWLEAEGVAVLRASIPEPGVHLMQGSVNTGLLMIGILGGLTLLLSAFLVTNVMSAVIAQQVPIIGVMKALGGGRGLVLWQYGRMVLAFGLMALALAVPLGLVGAWFMSSTLAGELNYDIPSFGLPWQTLLIQMAGALLVPALAALGPVRAAANLTIRDALSPIRDTTYEMREKRRAFPSYLLSRSSYLEDRISCLVAWRNVARRKVRLVLTLIALSLAGAMFIATFGLRLGLYEAIEILVGEFPYDVQLDFVDPERAQRMEREAAGVAGVARVEAWGVADARRIYADGRVGSSFLLFGVPETTEIADFANRDGQWLYGTTDDGPRATDGEVVGGPSSVVPVYINYETEKLIETPTVGDGLALKLNGGPERDTHLVGVSLRPFDANAYVPYAEFERMTGARGQAGRLVAYLTDEPQPVDEPARQAAVAAELVERLEAAGMPVLRVETAASFRDGYRAQFNNLVLMLMVLAGLTALVGGLGLANTMALNVLDRSREIGILRSMGAERPLLRRLVLAEGLAIALISALFGVLLSLPLTAILDRVMGNSLLGSPLSFAFSFAAALGWLALVLVIGLVACWVPAEGAARMTVREALAYE